MDVGGGCPRWSFELFLGRRGRRPYGYEEVGSVSLPTVVGALPVRCPTTQRALGIMVRHQKMF